VKLLLVVYIFTGFAIGPFSKDLAKHNTPKDWLILLLIHTPALLLTALGIWQAMKRGRFFDMDAPLFVITAAICYGIGIGLGFYAGI
jgi:hypothetical protein